MNEQEFNLIDEKWIRVMDSKCNMSELSLKEVILDSHKYKALSGELPTQDIAVMRLILAVLHTVYSRVDENGNDAPLDEDDEDAALERWKALWDKGQFSEKAIGEYFDKWRERFWLFHEERPFGQASGLSVGTEYDAPKLNGEISESSNKKRFFSMYSGDEKDKLTYPQAARWVLYLNAYDDTSSKPTKEGKEKAGGSLPSPGIGWLGKLGTIFLSGYDLFETLMLNLILVNSDGTVQAEQNPQWEQDKVSLAERTEVPQPNDLAALYTLQSRRILLNREKDKVVSYKLLGGDFFEKENAFIEPMTVWSTPKNEGDAYTPRRHDSSKQMWREFSALYEEKGNRCSGVVIWFRYLKRKKILPSSYMMRTAITSVVYGDKDFFVKNVFFDSLTMHSELLSDLGADWRNTIEQEIEKCSGLANAIGYLAQNLYVASGGSNSKKDKHYIEIPDNAKAQLYYRLDIPFREWLRSVDPECEDGKQRFEKQREWQDIAKKIAYNYAGELVSETDDPALVGHMIDKKLYSSANAMNTFNGQVNKIYPKERR